MFELEYSSVNDDTVKAIGEFAIAWSVFEKEFFNEEFRYQKIYHIFLNRDITNRTIIDNVKSAFYEYAYGNYPKEFSWMEKLDSKYISHHSQGKKIEDYVVPFFMNEQMDKEIEIITCIYIASRIRNNMFHGLKIVSMLNSQENIFRHLCLFIKSICESKAITCKKDKNPLFIGNQQ